MKLPIPSVYGAKDDLLRKVEELSDREIVVVDRVVTSILTPADHFLLDGSWLADEAWGDAFLALLRVHHGLSPEPLGTLQFETAFNDACTVAGWVVDPAAGATNRFYDTVIRKNGTSKVLSLKSTSAKGIRRDLVEISKLTEAAWIQDTRRINDRRDSIVDLFKRYRDSTDSIVILRAFREDDGILYQLVEIPTELFAAVDNLSVEDAQRGTIPFPSDTPVFKVGIDRSDAKVKLSARIDALVIHGEWKISTSMSG